MLDVTLSTAFVPGVNVRGRVSGANWIFLRPALGTGEVVCLGPPRSSTLATLAQFSHSVLVLHPGGQALDVDDVEWPKRPENVRLCGFDDVECLASRPQSTDVLLVTGWSAVWRLRRDPRLRRAVRRALKPDALVYYEYFGTFDPLRARHLIDHDRGQRFTLTPLRGELHTAVPADDQSMNRFFRESELLESPAPRTMTKIVRRATTWLARHRVVRPNGRPIDRVSPLEGGAGDQAAGRMAARARPRSTGNSWAQRLVERHGVLLGAPAAGLSDSPPQYICDVAAASGISLAGYRWGLAAKGEYTSRKLIFYLADRATGPGSGSHYIAKVVRNPSLNARLENEHRALSQLCADQVVDRETVPHPVFFGHHAGLAILGETVVEGTPFAQHTDATPDCPYLNAAVEWFTALGARTVAPRTFSSAEAAATLGWLSARFTELYHFDRGEREFLAGQIEAIRAAAETLPLTFQHGDPGLWNMLVTPSRRVALLDWEAAEPHGIPLWDLFYFLRSYVVRAAKLASGRNSLDGLADQLLSDTPISRMVATATRRYCRRIGVSEGLVEPLFYSCWMHRAIKEATRLPAEHLGSGHYVNLLRLTIARRRTPALRRLFAN
jgi:Phosphotransferase enzyme family